MAKIPISKLPKAISVGANDEVPVVQDNVTKKVAIEDIGKEINEAQEYSGLDSTDKTIIGAINKISSSLEGKAEASNVYTKDETYSKTEVHDIVVEELADNGASETGYDNTESGLEATNVQDAIDEVNTKIENIPSVDAYTKEQSDERYATATDLSDVSEGFRTSLTLGKFTNCKLNPTNGMPETASNRVSTADIFIAQNNIELTCAVGFRYYLIFYTNGTYAGVSGWQTGSYTLIGGNQYKIMIARTTEVTETANIDEFTSSVTYKSVIGEKVDVLENNVYKEFTPKAYHGIINSTNGVYSYHTFVFIYCVKLDTPNVIINTSSFSGEIGYALYDENKNLINAVRTTIDETISIDTSSAKYLRVSFKSGTDTSIKFVGTIENYFPVFSGESIDHPLNEMITDASIGDIIRIPKGQYNVANSIILKSDISIVGDGVSGTILNALPKNENNGNFSGAIFYRSELASGNLENLRISDMTIKRTNTSTYTVSSKGLYAQKCKNSIFENLRLIDIPATGLGIDYLQNVVIRNVYCFNCGFGWNTIGMGCSGIGVGTGFFDDESFIVDECICDTCGQAGIFIELQPETSGAYCIGENQVVANNIVKNSQYGILLSHGRTVSINSNVINGCENGITFRFKPERIVCNGNDIVKNTKGITTESDTSSGTVLLDGNILAENNIAVDVSPIALAMIGNFITNSITKDIKLTGDFNNKFVAKSNVQTGENDTSNASNFTIE